MHENQENPAPKKFYSCTTPILKYIKQLNSKMTFYIASHVEFETRKMRRQRSDIVYLSDRRDMLSGAVCVNQEARGLRNTLLMGLFSGLPTIIAHDSLCWVALGKLLSPSWSSPYSDVAFHWDFAAVVRQTSVSLIINTHSAFELLLQSLHQVLVMTILNMLCAVFFLTPILRKKS